MSRWEGMGELIISASTCGDGSSAVTTLSKSNEAAIDPGYIGA